jgi:hypothetical protein
MPKPILNNARIVAGVGEGITAGVAQHVGVNLERESGALTDALNKPVHSIRCERPAALSGEYKAAVWKLAAKLSQSADFISAQRMRRRLAVLCPPDMQRSIASKLHLRPFQVAISLALSP